jgi:high affinity sulfate transporter 1
LATSATSHRRTAPPLLGGILPIDPSKVSGDIIAGATLAALAIPEVMGYTKIAGMPVITGLYTIVLPIIAFAILGSSRHLVVGADSATAAIMATGLLGMGLAAESTTYIEMASLTALMCAVLLILARVLRLGFIANFLSRSVLIGFLTGVGIQVAMGQVGGMFGIPSQSGGTIEKFVESVRLIPTATNVPTLIVSITVLVLILGLGRVNKAIPGALIAVVVTIFASAQLNLAADGVSVLGTVPGGLPKLSLPTDVMTAANLQAILPTVVSLVVVILAQSAATSRAYAMKYSDSFEENVDLIGLGVANAAAGISGTFVVNGSPTKTEMVDSAGGRTQISQLTAAAIVVVVLLFLTGPLANMPNAVLASVVFIIGVRLIDYKGMADILRVRQGEFVVAAITAAVVVVVGVEQGIILAMALSIVEHIYHSYKPYDSIVIEGADGSLQTVPEKQGAQLAPGVMVYRFGASLYYANATRFTAEVMDLVDGAQPSLSTFVISGSAIGDIDYSGSDSLRQVQVELAAKGVTLALAELNPRVRNQLDEYGLTDKIGVGNIYDSIRDAVKAHSGSAGGAAAGGASAADGPGAAGGASATPSSP